MIKIGFTRANSILKAIGEIHQNTCIILRPASAHEKDYVEFQSDKEGCFSAAGKIGGKQVINLGPGCFKLDIIVALLEKALGFLDDTMFVETGGFDPYQRGFFDWVCLFLYIIIITGQYIGSFILKLYIHICISFYR